MKRYVLILALAIGSATLPACQKAGPDTQASVVAQSPAVATIDGKPISSDLFASYARERSGKALGELTDEQKNELLEQLIRLELTAGTAVKAGLDKESDTVARLEISRLSVLSAAALQHHLKGKEPTEQELRAEYETQVAALPKLEYRARHILVATESYAQALIDKLRKGTDFAALARKESMDARDNSGELGWFTPGRMVPEFAAAVAALKKGEITQKPVQTQYGWHIIQLQDTREVAVPDYEDVKQRLGQLIQQKKLQAYVDELKKTVKIETKI